ncbi:MAG TPA: class I SAM-dependent methyltransferase [Mariniphaga anaerophila]|uniref:Class I SAM-dependent methyltransferase n=1 Tax=Mariniphaga anaerophila TaxID=1484053 RepID=A0A831L9D1_9BACT|nr:class I SAM-dependent methyltransferase [Mariniphaga anaerophila]
MSEFWNERYALKEYAYGTEPNRFFEAQIKRLSPGKVLFPAEGEGRNAVHAAKNGWEVYAFDSSKEACKKAENLAAVSGVSIQYKVTDFDKINFPAEFFDSIVLIFAHFHPLKRKEYHQKLISFLKPGGTFIIEGFSKKQMQFNSGGPRNIEMLFSKQEIEEDFSSLSELNLEEQLIELDEGPFHQGIASFVRMIGTK